MKAWIQYFGCPKNIKLDKEGARRGRDLEAWADQNGVALLFVPAEAHGQVGLSSTSLFDTFVDKRMILRRQLGPLALDSSAQQHVQERLVFPAPVQWVFGEEMTDSY